MKMNATNNKKTWKINKKGGLKRKIELEIKELTKVKMNYVVESVEEHQKGLHLQHQKGPISFSKFLIILSYLYMFILF